MKKSLIALAVMAAAGAASAQSSVTLFGIVDATLNYTKNTGTGGTTVWQLGNSGYNSSRLGFRGVEDLGGGMSATFWLEGGITNDDGRAGGTILCGNMPTPTAGNACGATVAGNTGFNFNRKSHVSLTGPWGEMRLGRDYSASFWNLTVFDPFGTNGAGTTMTFIGPGGYGLAPGGTAGPTVRVGNSIMYFLPPNLGGIYGEVQGYLGENAISNPAAAGNKKDGTGLGFRVGYASGPFDVAFAWQRTAYATTFAPTPFTSPATGDYTVWNLAGSWNFGVAKAMAQYQRDERDSASKVKGTSFLLGASVPVGPGEIRGSYSQYTADVAVGPDPKGKKWAIGYVHNLSKRTALYTTLARLSNSGGSALALSGTATVNGNSTGWDLGIRHSF